jgi:hypothetical protein
MAQTEHHHIEPGERRQWDGRAQCRLCTHDQSAEQDWCPAAEALVCDSCCYQIISGDPRRLLNAAQAASRTVSPLDIIANCSDCGRLPRMLVEDEQESAPEEPETVN